MTIERDRYLDHSGEATSEASWTSEARQSKREARAGLREAQSVPLGAGEANRRAARGAADEAPR